MGFAKRATDGDIDAEWGGMRDCLLKVADEVWEKTTRKQQENSGIVRLGGGTTSLLVTSYQMRSFLRTRILLRRWMQ